MLQGTTNGLKMYPIDMQVFNKFRQENNIVDNQRITNFVLIINSVILLPKFVKYQYIR